MSSALRHLSVCGSRTTTALAATTGRTTTLAALSTSARAPPTHHVGAGLVASNTCDAKKTNAGGGAGFGGGCGGVGGVIAAVKGDGGGTGVRVGGASSGVVVAGKRAVSSTSSPLSPWSSGSGGGDWGGGPLAARVDAVVVGAGQAGLSVAYHLQKAGGLRFVTLDANQEAGGAWRHRWPSLELFSTRKWSSLPGYPMFANGACEDGYPSTREMALYMEEYESVMNLNVVRPVTVTGVSRTNMGTFLVETDCLHGGTPARWEARTVISASGTHASPILPRLPGSEAYRGVQIHSSQYRFAEDFRGARVAVVGAGNSGAQILAEVSHPGMASSVMWSTKEEPSFLPEGMTGKEIFDTVARLRQRQGFVREEDIPSLTSVIMQPGVVDAAERGVYDARAPVFSRLTPTGVAWDAAGGVPAGEAEVDAIIWCTGYRANTSHLSRLGIVRQDATVAMDDREMGESNIPGIFAVGYGNWAGVGSGSIPGATMYAKRAAASALHHLRGGASSDSSMAAVEATLGPLPFSGSPLGSRAWPASGRTTAATMSSRAATVGESAGVDASGAGVSRIGQASLGREAGVEREERIAVAA